MDDFGIDTNRGESAKVKMNKIEELQIKKMQGIF